MKPTREPRFDRLDGQLMPDVVRADAFLPHYFAGLRKDLPPADLWNHYVISNPGLRLTIPDGGPDEYSGKLMDGKMHKEAYQDALKEGRFHETEYGVPFRALVEWGLSKGYVPRAALYSALYAKEPNWRKASVTSIDWRVIDAVYYALGRAPLSDNNLQWYELKPHGLIDEETLLRMANRAIEIKELPAWQEPDWLDTLGWRVTPKNFCLWFREKGLALPEPLDRLMEGTLFAAQNTIEKANSNNEPRCARKPPDKMEFTLTVAQAARRLCKELDDTISFSGAKSQISKKCDQGIIFSEGKGVKRRINEDSLNSFILEKRNQRLQEDY